MQRAALLICLLASLIASVAAAEPPGFKASWEAGQDAFNLGKYTEARRHFVRARDLSPKLPGPHRWLGRIARVLEEWEECVASSTTAVRLKPGSPQVPEVKKDLDACRSALGRPLYGRPLREGQGALAVSADIEGAQVTVDGIAKGPTPLEPMPLSPGRHRVRAAVEGRSPPSVAEIEIEVVPGIVVDAQLTLAR